MTPRLTPRQWEILTLRANGYTNAQIATRLHLRADTVSGILTRAYRNLGASNGVQGACIALITGELRVSDIEIPDEHEDTAA
jgi:DNA-binding NarL/FixJ family response regulator